MFDDQRWAGRQDVPQTIWLPQQDQLRLDSMARMAVIGLRGFITQ